MRRSKTDPPKNSSENLEPWQALGNAVIIQAAKDYRNMSKMHRKLMVKESQTKTLTADGRAYLNQRIHFYRKELCSLRSFFCSDTFMIYTNLDRRILLRKLESERY